MMTWLLIIYLAGAVINAAVLGYFLKKEHAIICVHNIIKFIILTLFSWVGLLLVLGDKFSTYLEQHADKYNLHDWFENC